jgi:hypothetical protein
MIVPPLDNGRFAALSDQQVGSFVCNDGHVHPKAPLWLSALPLRQFYRSGERSVHVLGSPVTASGHRLPRSQGDGWLRDALGAMGNPSYSWPRQPGTRGWLHLAQPCLNAYPHSGAAAHTLKIAQVLLQLFHRSLHRLIEPGRLLGHGAPPGRI